MISQLSLLASQHHTSDYNRIKFGVQGSPIKYHPISLHLPDLFKELQLRQLESSDTKPWWYCNKFYSPAIIIGPSGAQPHQTTLLQEQIQAAILSPLPEPFFIYPSDNENQFLHSVKTSSTHPINISPIIPFELVLQISSHLFLSQLPTVFSIPSSFALDHLISSSQQKNPVRLPPTSKVMIKHLHTPTSVTEALQAAITSDLSIIHTHTDSNNLKRTTSQIPSSTITPPVNTPASHGTLPTFHSNASSVSLTLSLANSESPPLSATALPTKPRLDPALLVHHGFPTSGKNSCDPTVVPFASRHPQPILVHSPPFSVGNLFLSSCPGKKVRLQGSVKGRSGVCRDLDTDLKRIKGLGVGCIVCCLDDTELEFLGVPWPEYEECARRNEMDVLRLPTPEGLAPLTPASLDTHLTELIKTFTLHGVPVLIHCRGGVGRAGVVACCWLIKLGLCGWVEPDGKAMPCTASSNHPDFFPPASKDTVRFVEKIIAVVRKRRSMKAVETYEQVSFLVDFVEYLRGRTGGRAIIDS